MIKKIIFAVVYLLVMTFIFFGLHMLGIDYYTHPILSFVISVVLGLFGGAVLINIDD